MEVNATRKLRGQKSLVSRRGIAKRLPALNPKMAQFRGRINGNFILTFQEVGRFRTPW
jgi:hypothetical protein